MPKQVTLKQVPLNQLMCMGGGYNHPWEPIVVPRKVGQWGRRDHARCVRCGKERVTIRDIYDRTAARYYVVPDWHVKVTEPFDSYDVADELTRRMNSRAKMKSAKTDRRHLRAV